MNLKNRYLPKKAELKRNAGGLKYAQISSALCLAILMMLCANSHAQAQQEAQPQEAAQQSAAQSIVLTPDEAVDLAIKSNLSLETSRVNLAAKKRASNLSWNQFIPSVQIAGSLSRDNQASDPVVVSQTFPYPDPSATGIPFEFEGITGQIYPPGSFGLFKSDPIDSPQWHIVGTIQASLNINFAMFENMYRLGLDYEGGLLSYEKAKIQLERDVRKAYHNMLLLQENIALLRSSFENAERQVQMAQANYNAGLAPELTLLQARVSRENLRPVIDQAENGRKISMAQFAMFLGMDYDTQYVLVPVEENFDIIPLDVSEMISKAAAGKPDIQELRYTIRMLQSARRAQYLLLTPTLTLSWNHQSIFLKDPWDNSWYGSKEDWRRSGSFTISLGMRLHSLIPFSADFQGIRTLDDQIRTATIGLAQMVNITEIEVYNIILTLERTRTNTEALAQTVSLAEQSYRATEQAYRAGLQDYFQVQNAQQSLNQARVQLLEQQFNYLNSLIDLEYSIGVPFGTLSGRK